MINKYIRSPNKEEVRNNRVMKKILETNFSNYFTNEDHGKQMIGGGSKLMSYSSFFKPCSNLVFYNTPKHITFIGSEVMRMLEYTVNNEIRDLQSLQFVNNQIKSIFMTIMNYLIENKMRIKACEKVITNGKWLGYIDLIVRHEGITKIVEIKTRKGTDLRKSDEYQMKVYANILGIGVNSIVMIVDRTTYKLATYNIKFHSKKEINLVNNMLDIYGLEHYKLYLKPNIFMKGVVGEKNYDLVLKEKEDEIVSI